MAICRPTPGFKGRTFNMCVLTKWDFNFCIRSSPLRGWLSAAATRKMGSCGRFRNYASRMNSAYTLASRVEIRLADLETFRGKHCRVCFVKYFRDRREIYVPASRRMCARLRLVVAHILLEASNWQQLSDLFLYCLWL